MKITHYTTAVAVPDPSNTEALMNIIRGLCYGLIPRPVFTPEGWRTKTCGPCDDPAVLLCQQEGVPCDE